MWRILAWLLTRFDSASWLLAMSYPYKHIEGPDGSIYMYRWWIFNHYDAGYGARWKWLPSVRLHRIMRPDSDRAPHDHPWTARTIVLKGWYREESLRPIPELKIERYAFAFFRERGYTGTLGTDQFHRILDVSEGGVWTLFFTWGKNDSWGFLVNGVKVPWREHLARTDSSQLEERKP
jgi:hypothetical protein